MGYFASYDATMPIADVEWDGITHAMAFAALPTNTGGLDLTFSKGSVAQGTAWVDELATAAHNAGKKVFLTVGGGGTHDPFIASMADATYRTSFVQAIVSYISARNLDGLDVDYEPMVDADIPSLLAFLDEIRIARPGMQIAICNGALNNNIRASMLSDSNLLAVSQRVDMINSMTYGMAGDWSGWKSWHSAAIYGHTPSTPMDIDSTVATCLNAGIPAAKIGIGAGYYGIGYTGCTGPVQTYATFAGTDNTFNYNTIVNSYLPSMTRAWDATSKVPYLWSTTGTGATNATYISYDDPQSIMEKATYIKAKGLGGIIAWHVAHQYFPANALGSRHPLLSATYDSLLK